MTVALMCLSAVGLLISSYFTGVAYRWIRPDSRWVPVFCRMGEQTCASVVYTPRARVFGLPNSVLGQVFYLAVFGGSALGALTHPTILPLYLLASAVTVGLAIYLSYSLLYITRVNCVLCFASHGINVVIFALLVSVWV